MPKDKDFMEVSADPDLKADGLGKRRKHKGKGDKPPREDKINRGKKIAAELLDIAKELISR